MKKYNITVNGTSYEVVVEEVESAGTISGYTAPAVSSSTVVSTLSKPASAKAPVATGTQSETKISSPMPGTILDVKVSVGQSVKKGDVICVLEAMKMENDIPASSDGIVASINIQKGASVNAGDVLATLN